MTGGFGGMLSIRIAGGEEQAMAVAAAVRIFKRATSLGGVESLIEARRSVEGPSSSVPGDLLRLSIGLEAPEDLMADLEAALAAVPRPATVGRSRIAEGATDTATAGSDLTTAVKAALDRSVTPTIIARGGAVRLAHIGDGVVTLRATGSPGATLPAAEAIEALVRAAVPEVSEVRIVWQDREPAPVPSSGDLAARVRRVVEDEVNPAIAAHRGHVVLVDVVDGRVQLRLEGGCQGCSLAEVTVRQGIERLLRARFAEIEAVVDVTDHEAGSNPFFTPEKR
jgi:Fe-S cluster biogenesis protein NfuA